MALGSNDGRTMAEASGLAASTGGALSGGAAVGCGAVVQPSGAVVVVAPPHAARARARRPAAARRSRVNHYVELPQIVVTRGQVSRRSGAMMDVGHGPRNRTIYLHVGAR